MKKNYLGIDIGGTNTKFCVVNNNKIIYKYSIPSNLNKIQPWIKLIILIIKRIQEKYLISKIAISSAGVINKVGKVLTANNKNYISTDWKKIIDRKIGKNLFSHSLNDAKSLATYLQTQTKDKDFISITIGTGVGFAIVQDNKLIYGQNYISGEIGSFIFKGRKNIDKTLSASVLNGKIRDILRQEKFSFNDLEKVYESNEEVKKLVIKWVSNFSKLVTFLILILSSQSFYISGGISYSGKFLLELIKKNIDAYMPKHIKYKTKIQYAKNKNDANILGLFT